MKTIEILLRHAWELDATGNSRMATAYRREAYWLKSILLMGGKI